MPTHRRTKPLPPPGTLVARLARHGAIAAAMIVVSLGIGVAGYHATAGLPWIDALLNASMILTGMGPVDPLQNAGAKLFASAYALFSGVAFLTIVAVVMAPLAHRFHLELDEDLDGRD